MSRCRRCGRDQFAEPEARLGSVRYEGSRPEVSISFPVPCPGRPVTPFADLPLGSHRNEVVAMPAGRWMCVSVWAAVYLAGARQRHGPWVRVRLTPTGWQEVQRWAPWIRTAADATQLLNSQILSGFRDCVGLEE